MSIAEMLPLLQQHVLAVLDHHVVPIIGGN